MTGLLAFVLGLSLNAIAQSPSNVDRALHHALYGTAAIGVVVDAKTGGILTESSPRAATLLSTPGSALKPFFLAAAIQTGKVNPAMTVVCHRSLRIADHNLACSHPQADTAFDGAEAVAYSCNSYFAALAGRFSGTDVEAVLRKYKLMDAGSSGFQRPATREQAQLAVLGIEGIRVTPLALARGFAELAANIDANPVTLRPVKDGIQDSIAFGSAHNAEVNGMEIAGKTGTASNPGHAWTHGWFAGIVPAGKPAIVIVVYVPRGNGGEAAALARKFFLEYQAAQR